MDIRASDTIPTIQQWSALVRGYQDAKGALCACADLESEEGESVQSAYSDALDAFMTAPAPDAAALRVKLERFLIGNGDEDEPELPCWPSEYVNSILADVRRIMGGPSRTDRMATEIQTKAIQIEHLIAAAFDAIDPFYPEDPDPAKAAQLREDGDRVAAFLPLAVEVAREIGNLGERIERAAAAQSVEA
ncbi:hypothetical protein [Novosphingobium sp.]|uniref:hypothetical protein n=1 Tax=Novosphingobium sp. TaxID=1874826 RepID=UPI0035B3E637